MTPNLTETPVWRGSLPSARRPLGAPRRRADRAPDRLPSGVRRRAERGTRELQPRPFPCQAARRDPPGVARRLRGRPEPAADPASADLGWRGLWLAVPDAPRLRRCPLGSPARLRAAPYPRSDAARSRDCEAAPGKPCGRSHEAMRAGPGPVPCRGFCAGPGSRSPARGPQHLLSTSPRTGFARTREGLAVRGRAIRLDLRTSCSGRARHARHGQTHCGVQTRRVRHPPTKTGPTAAIPVGRVPRVPWLGKDGFRRPVARSTPATGGYSARPLTTRAPPGDPLRPPCEAAGASPRSAPAW